MFDAPTVYRKSYDDYWPRLLELQKVEGDFSIATTEVGMPAVLFPCHVIHDISGLNAAKLIAEGLNAETIMRYCQADLLLLPHPNYVRLNRELQASQAFQTAYIQIPAAKFEAELAVAIKKDSPFRDALLAVYPQ